MSSKVMLGKPVIGSAPAAGGRSRSRKPDPAGSGGGGEAPAAPPREATTLDRVHTAMLLAMLLAVPR